MLTDRQRSFVDHLVDYRCSATEAARRAGYREGPGLRVTASRLMKRPEVQTYMKHRVGEVMSLHAARAVSNLNWLAREANSEWVRLDASRDVLNRAGFNKKANDTTKLGQGVIVDIDLE